MKKIFFLLALMIISITYVKAESVIDIKANSAILIEPITGKVIFEKNADEQLKPASMTKIMSLILIMEQIDSNKMNLDDEVLVSKEASSMGGSQVYINEGETYKVEELLKGVAIASANDAVVALGEKVAGTKDNFVNMMNRKKDELGLMNTNFVNPHGLDDENHYSSARDMALMARELIKHKKILDYTKRYEDYFKKKDGSSIWLVNTNKLVKFYEGMDGLKTGYTSSAGYCLTATAVRNNFRLISVVMGEDSIENRTEDTLKLLNYGFNTMKVEEIISKNKPISSAKIRLSDKNKYDLYLNEDVIRLYEINGGKLNYTYKLELNKNIKAPLKKGQNVGKIKIYINDGSILTKDVIVNENVRKISFIKLMMKNINKITSGIK